MSIVSVNNTNVAVDDSCHKIANVDGLNLFISYGSAWHGLGRETDSLFDLTFIREVFPEMLNTIDHSPCWADVNGERVLISDVNAIIFRQPNGQEKFFESRSANDSRPIIQPEELLTMLEDSFKRVNAKFSSVGYLYGGETFFVSAELAEGFSIAGDEHKSYLSAIDGYTGLQTLKLFGSAQRAVCANTCRSTWSASTDKFQLNHTGDLKSRVEQLVLSFKAIVDARPKAIELLNQSTAIQINPSVAINRVLDSIFGIAGLNVNVTLAESLDVTAAAQKRLYAIGNKTDFSPIDHTKMVGLIGKQISKRQSVFDSIMNNYESTTCQTARGSAYSAYQAITEYANYGIASKKTDRQQGNDFLSLATGKGGELTDAAWNALVVAV